MKINRLAKKYLPLLLSFSLLLAFLPMTAAAADQRHWAADAADTLNGVYGDGIFSASESFVTVDAARELVTRTLGYPPGYEPIDGYLGHGTLLTRLQAAQIAYELYGLGANLSAGPFTDTDNPAVVTLRSLGVVAGHIDGSFRPSDPVSKAELAVIFYRTLSKVGGTGNMLLEHAKPGAFGYNELMYLATRSALQYDADPGEALATASIGVSNDEERIYYQGKKEIWNAWSARLGNLPPQTPRTVTWTVYDQVPAVTVLDAALQIVAEDRAALDNDGLDGLFSDVPADSYFYDGIMYLLNNGLVVGNGRGQFAPNAGLSRSELAALLVRMNKIDVSKPADATVTDIVYDHWSYNLVTNVIALGYMDYTDGHNFSPLAQVTRQEAFQAVYKSYGKYADEAVSLSVLDRFTDKADIKESCRAAAAYFVSAGVVRGNAEGNLDPEGLITRGQLGVFLARVMNGPDTSKMHDYSKDVREVLE
jgi:hypothetical protein